MALLKRCRPYAPKGELRRLDYAQADIVKMASYVGAAQTLKTLSLHYLTLRGAYFSHQMIRSVALTGGPTKRLNFLVEHHAALRARGHSSEAIIGKAKGRTGTFTAWIEQQLLHELG